MANNNSNVRSDWPDQRRRGLLLGAAAAPLVSMLASPAQAADRAAPDAFKTALQQRLQDDGVGFAAAQLGPAGLRLHAAGVRRIGDADPITTRTLFELGSLTKTFVALLLADGVLNRRFALEDPVEAGLPDGMQLRDSLGQPLRLIDLATHRSGLPRMPGNLSRKEAKDPYPFYTEARMFEFLRGWRPPVARGARFEYSNLGYGLLGQVLARRLGTSLDDALRRHVLQPLGLDDLRIARPLQPSNGDLASLGSALAASRIDEPRLAAAHDGERRPTMPWRFDAMAGAVGLQGSIESVGRFLQAAVGGFEHPLRDAFAMCLQYRTEGEHPLHPFGFGWEISTIVAADGSKRWFYNQDGATAGFSISAWIEPAARRGGAVLSNSFIETRSLALQALDSSISEADFNLVALPAAVVQRMTGQWWYRREAVVMIEQREGRLWVRGDGHSPIELVPVSAHRLVSRDSPLEFIFEAGEQPRKMTMKREGNELQFTREKP